MTADQYSHVRTFGCGKRRALAIHCTLGHAGAWRAIGAVLQDQLTLTAFDLPGHGKSADWDGQEDLHRLCTDAALTHLTKPMDVIGHSFGATVALRLAVEHPQLVRTLTLIEPVFFAVVLADAPECMRAHSVEAEPYFAALQKGDTVLAARLFNWFWGDGAKWEHIPETTRQYLADRMHVVPGQAPMIIDDNAGLLAPGRMACAGMPCLLLEGDQAADVIRAVNHSLAKRLPNARRVTIPGAGHMSPVTHPQAVAHEIAGLLEIAEE